MKNQLIPVFNGTINNEAALLCDARELHKFLGVGKVFAAWIAERIKQYGFTENQDYIITFSKTGKRQNVICKDYHLTLDTAKELAMVERNEKGREARRYFIDCEKQLLRQQKPEILEPVQETIKRRGAYRKDSSLPCGVYHNQSKYNPYRACVWDGSNSVHVGSYPTVDDAVAAIAHYNQTGAVQRLQAARAVPHIDVIAPAVTQAEKEALICNLQAVLHNFRYINAVWREQLRPMLAQVQSPLIGKMQDRFVDSMSVIPMIEEYTGRYLPPVRR